MNCLKNPTKFSSPPAVNSFLTTAVDTDNDFLRKSAVCPLTIAIAQYKTYGTDANRPFSIKL